MTGLRWVLAAALLCGGCRTMVDLNPTPPGAGPEGPNKDSCDVRDFPSAVDVPPGSKNIGWVRVAREKTDEDTYLALRKAICEKGGDALSQLHWVKEPQVWEPTALEANAWTMP